MAKLATIQAAWAMLAREGITGTLVGTAALQLRGYPVDAPDIDFLCERAPEGVARAYCPTGCGVPEPFMVHGVKVDFIDADDEGRQRFLNPRTAETIDGVPVAAIEDVIGLKRWADRPKDRTFLAGLDHYAPRS